MTLHPLKHLSASSIQDYHKCPLGFYGRRIFGWIESGERNELAMALGIAVHYALSAHHRGGDAELTLLEGIDGKGANKGHGIRSLVTTRQLTDMLNVIGKYTARYDHAVTDRPAHWFEIDIPGVPLKFVGEFDLLCPNEINEFKTTSSATWWTQVRVDTEVQASAYWYAFCALEGHDPDRMRYHILPIGGAKVGHVHAFETHRGAADKVVFEALVQATYAGIQSAPLEAACLRSGAQSLGSQIDYGKCSFHANCPRWAGTDLEKLSERVAAWQAGQSMVETEIKALLEAHAPEEKVWA